MKDELSKCFAQSILSCIMDKIDHATNYGGNDLVISYTEVEQVILSFIKEEVEKKATPAELDKIINEDFKI